MNMSRLCSLLLTAATLVTGSAAQAQISVQGAGATFPYPIYSKWISEYQKVDPGVRIDYQSIGSGGGIRQILERTVDFGASDAPMTPQERAKAKATLHHIPMTLGAVVVGYNVPGVGTGLKLDPAALSGIFLGQITKWNDGRIVGLNPGVKLPGTTITVAYRSDGSGTTSVFTEYLAKVSMDWKSKVGAGKSVKFPVGLGAKGNEGVTGMVKTTPGAIGYLELAYAKQNNMATASIRNKAGKFVAPTPEGVTSAASGNEVPSDLCISITDGPGAKDYPISSFSYLLVYQEQQDATKGKAVANFLWWAIHDGQKYAAALDYAPLPKSLLPKLEARVKTLTAGGKPLLNKK
jgi:phosphate transport system substrate-binding protein